MPRTSPRIATYLPAKIIGRSTQTDVIITDIGLTGTHLTWLLPFTPYLKIDDPILLRYAVPGKGYTEQRGKVARMNANGCGVHFADLDVIAKHNLWQFISDQMAAIADCPYCGDRLDHPRTRCVRCECRLDFAAPDYLGYMEKNRVVKRLTARLHSLDMEQLEKVASLVTADLTPGEEVQVTSDQDFVGTSPLMMEVFTNIRKVAPTGLSVLILGESGTGKELTAMAIHERSMRKGKPFVAINSAAIPESLLEAELFGYEKGAFTGAYASKKGKFEQADGGTLFLDEIGDMPLNLQTKLLRFLQDKTIDRVGGIRGKKIDVRLIAATNQDLHSLVTAGRFRGDLYHRLDEFTIHLPPLRERGDDRVVLARFFLNKFSKEMGEAKTFGRDALDALLSYSWPGNVRELINKVRRAIVMSEGCTINAQHLSLDPAREKENSEPALLEFHKIKEALLATNNNISKAAKLLGLSRPTLYSRLKKHAAFALNSDR